MLFLFIHNAHRLFPLDYLTKQTTRTETKIENMSIAEDEVKLTIEGLFDVSGLIESHSSRNVGISYLLGINKDETVPVLTPQYKYENGAVKMNYTVTLPILKRGKHVQTLYARKKATFDIILYKGFWKGNETLCSAVLPLADLITKSTVGGPVALKSVNPEGSSGKKAKALGGSLNVTVSIRSPLGGPEIVYSEERKLVIEPWPAVVTPVHSPVPVPPAVPRSEYSSEQSSMSGVKATTDANRAGTPTLITTTDDAASKPTPLTGAFATLTDKERTDPHNVDFIESNDVLEYEIATAQALMASSADEDEQFNSNMRVQLLNTKLQLLVYSVQNETLTMEQYLENIKNRVKRDQLIALYFKNLGDKENVDIALQVMKRVTIMKKEIQNAEEAQQEEE